MLIQVFLCQTVTLFDMKKSVAIIWFRRDLRVDDQPALRKTFSQGAAVVPLYIHAPEEEGAWAPGAASRWWLHHSLKNFDGRLKSLGSRLILRRGPTLQALLDLCDETGATQIYWNRLFEPSLVARDRKIEEELRAKGKEVYVDNGTGIFPPWRLLKGNGLPYKVFTAFWNNLRSLTVDAPVHAPKSKLRAPGRWPRSVALPELGLLPGGKWAEGIDNAWEPSEEGAGRLLKRFTRRAVQDYSSGRDLPEREGTSRLSPFLHFGEVSVRRAWHCAAKQPHSLPFLRQLAWREFATYLLYYFPFTPDKPLRDEFERFAWRKDSENLRAWQQGKTGYPFVDAGMRQLWKTGWMHNRVRMVAASFLVKHLLTDWREGARWFWDTLVDADLANNTMGWQWVAGCGADAAPYFRIFNPVLQGQRFDPQGDYVRRWVPELAHLPAAWIHRPWEAPGEVLREAGVELGHNYPAPVVEHSGSRKRALMAYHRMKKSSK
jgi:deoxyribodipyrimidine photo-lyase